MLDMSTAQASMRASALSACLPSTTPPITVIDAIMGSGKTTWAHRWMTSQYLFGERPHGISPGPYLFITPFKAEAQRCVETCSQEMQFHRPKDEDDPDWNGLSKSNQLEWMLRQGMNIATTHSLFSIMSATSLEAIRRYGYILVMDEAFSAFEKVPLKKSELDHLFANQMIEEEPTTGRLLWVYDKTRPELDALGHRFDDVRRKAQTGTLQRVHDTTLIWELPAEVLQSFSKVVILTYLFEGSTLAAYLRANGFPYALKSLSRDRDLIDLKQADEKAIKRGVRDRLIIYEGPRNNIGASRRASSGRIGSPLSKTSLTRSMNKEDLEGVVKAMTSFVKHDIRKLGMDGRIGKIAWTTFNAARPRLPGKRFRSDDHFIPLNAKASNDWAHKEVMMYVADRYMDPITLAYLQSKGQTLNQDLMALSDLLQWLWRGCIRKADGPTMVAFIPAERMRQLLELWLESDSYDELVGKLSGKVVGKMTA